MKQIESIKVGVGCCQIYLRDNEEFYKQQSLMYQLTSNYYEDKDRALPGNKISLVRDTIKIKTNLAAGTIRNTITSLVKKKMLLKDSRYKAVILNTFLKVKYLIELKL